MVSVCDFILDLLAVLCVCLYASVQDQERECGYGGNQISIMVLEMIHENI